MNTYYQLAYAENKLRSMVWQEIIRYEQRFFPADPVVVDLAAGYCNFVNTVVASKKYAVDLSPDITRYAAPDVETRVTAIWELGHIPDRTVHIVHASNILEHLTDEELEKTMREIDRVIIPGGIVVLMQPNFRYAFRYYFDDYDHRKIFTDIGLELFFRSHGYETVHKKPKFLPFSMDTQVTKLPIPRQLVRAYLHSPFRPFAGQMLVIMKHP